MRSKYRLWQTGNVKKKADSNDRILGQFDFDYMGSAEFEFGAIPKALGNFLKCEEPKIFDKVNVIVGDKTYLVHYWVRESQQERLEDALLDIPATRKHLKERCDFLVDFKGRELQDRVIFGIDPGLEFFAWTNKTVKSRILDTMEETISVLTENKWM